MSDTAGSRNDGVVDQLLLEADLDDDGQLRPALLQLRALAAEAPVPSAGVAALMANAGTARAAAPATPTMTAVDLQVVEPATAALQSVEPAAMRHAGRPADELAARRRAKRRITLTTLSVAASLAAGGAVAVASDQGFRDSVAQLNQAVTSFVTGTSATPAGSTGGDVPAPRPAAPGTATSPDAVPTATAPATAPVPAPAAGTPAATPARPGNAPTDGQPGEKNPVQPTTPGSAAEDVRKGLDEASKLPVPAPTEMPLPGKIPDVPLR